jgi:rhodanese-related sulfurtransferase
VREPEEFAEAHIPGSINLPQADLATRLDELSHDSTIWTTCRTGARSLRAAQFLKQAGFEHVASVRGGIVAWQESGRESASLEGAGTGRRIVETEWMHAGGVTPVSVT